MLFKGIELFNSGDFFSAHDFFEDLWHGAKSKDRNFYQGLTQISVSCFHLVSGNFTGALSQINKAKNKLVGYKGNYQNIDIDKLKNEIEILTEEIISLINNKSKTVDFKKIPVLKITNQIKGAE